MDFGRSGNRSWRSRESVKEREKEGEGEYQLLLECVATRGREEGGGVCVCLLMCVQRSVGFMLRSSRSSEMRRVLCWQPSDCWFKLSASLDARLKQSSAAFFQNPAHRHLRELRRRSG